METWGRLLLISMFGFYGLESLLLLTKITCSAILEPFHRPAGASPDQGLDQNHLRQREQLLAGEQLEAAAAVRPRHGGRSVRFRHLRRNVARRFVRSALVRQPHGPQRSAESDRKCLEAAQTDWADADRGRGVLVRLRRQRLARRAVQTNVPHQPNRFGPVGAGRGARDEGHGPSSCRSHDGLQWALQV